MRNTGGGFNRYAYANNNPYKYVDPDGRNPLAKLAQVLVKVLVKTEQQAAKGASKAPAPATAKPSPNTAASPASATPAAPSGATGAPAGKPFSKEKQDLVEMAKGDKKNAITKADMDAYKDLNQQLPDPFPANKVRGPEAHSSGAPSSQAPHGHVGPVDHIPVK